LHWLELEQPPNNHVGLTQRSFLFHMDITLGLDQLFFGVLGLEEENQYGSGEELHSKKIHKHFIKK
jgi:hypothetical protein